MMKVGSDMPCRSENAIVKANEQLEPISRYAIV
jgi:hypothetical protein